MLKLNLNKFKSTSHVIFYPLLFGVTSMHKVTWDNKHKYNAIVPNHFVKNIIKIVFPLLIYFNTCKKANSYVFFNFVVRN